MKKEREILKYYKKLENGSYVYNYDSIYKENFPINIIFSERGEKGKTYGLKELIFQEYLDEINRHNIPCLFLRSQENEIKEEKKRFLNKLPPNLNDNINDLKIVGNELFYKKDKIFIFGNVGSPKSYKGSRSIVNHIVWDEFNEGIKLFKEDVNDNISNILSSANNPHEKNKDGDSNNKRFWILGNNKGLNHPLIIQLGIEGIYNEVTKLYLPNGNPFIMILCPIYDEEDIKKIEEKNENDWIYHLTKKLGTADHIYFNINNFDKLNYIKRYFEFTKEEIFWNTINETINLTYGIKPTENNFNLIGTVLINGNYLNILKIPTDKIDKELKTKYHVINISLLCNYAKKEGINLNIEDLIWKDETRRPLVYTTNKSELCEGVAFMPHNYKQNFINKFADCEFSFENATSRSNFISLLQK